MSSAWAQLYLSPESEEYIMTTKPELFRMRFRLTGECFEQLLGYIEDDRAEYFSGFGRADAAGRPGVPIDLLLLGALRYLGRHCHFDDLQEATKVDKETHRRFFVRLCYWGRTRLFRKFCSPPSTNEEISNITKIYAAAGFPGCMGSFDVTHIPLQALSVNLVNQYKNGKHDYPTKAFQVVVDHTSKVLSVCPGMPGTYNDKTIDKTIVKYDDFVTSLRTNPLFRDYKWSRYDGTGRVCEDRGVYCIVDGGYTQQPHMMSAFHSTSDDNQAAWGQMLGSLRKDVECFFGRLKKRFTIFHDGIRVHDVDRLDDIFFFCCALHNWLHSVDGLDENWELGWTQEVRYFVRLYLYLTCAANGRYRRGLGSGQHTMAEELIVGHGSVCWG